MSVHFKTVELFPYNSDFFLLLRFTNFRKFNLNFDRFADTRKVKEYLAYQTMM